MYVSTLYFDTGKVTNHLASCVLGAAYETVTGTPLPWRRRGNADVIVANRLEQSFPALCADRLLPCPACSKPQESLLEFLQHLNANPSSSRAAYDRLLGECNANLLAIEPQGRGRPSGVSQILLPSLVVTPR